MNGKRISSNRQRFEVGGRSLCLAVCESVAEVTGKDPTELEILEHHVDTDALETLVARTDDLVATFEWEDVVIQATSEEVVVEKW